MGYSALDSKPIRSTIIERISVHVFESNEVLGRKAADDLAAMFSHIIGEKGRAGVIFASASSQLTFLRALRVRKDIEWDKVIVFHMDEYLGMSDQHPASFARFISQELVSLVHPNAFYPIRGNSPDVNGLLYFEIGRWIIEGQVTVFTDPQDTHIRRVSA